MMVSSLVIKLQTDIRRDQIGVLFLNGNRLQVKVVDGRIRMAKPQIIRRGHSGCLWPNLILGTVGALSESRIH